MDRFQFLRVVSSFFFFFARSTEVPRNLIPLKTHTAILIELGRNIGVNQINQPLC